jgi:hypothetical protein
LFYLQVKPDLDDNLFNYAIPKTKRPLPALFPPSGPAETAKRTKKSTEVSNAVTATASVPSSLASSFKPRTLSKNIPNSTPLRQPTSSQAKPASASPIRLTVVEDVREVVPPRASSNVREDVDRIEGSEWRRSVAAQESARREKRDCQLADDRVERKRERERAQQGVLEKERQQQIDSQSNDVREASKGVFSSCLPNYLPETV